MTIVLLLVLTIFSGTVPVLWAAGFITGWAVIYILLAIWVLGVVTFAARA